MNALINTEKLREQLLEGKALALFDKDKFIGVISANDFTDKFDTIFRDGLDSENISFFDLEVNSLIEIIDRDDLRVIPLWKETSSSDLVETGKSSLFKNKESANKSSKEAEKSQINKNIIDNLSHELYTPLNSLIGFSEALREPGLPEFKVQAFGELINKSSRQLINLLDNALLMLKFETGQLNLVIKEIRVNEFLNDLYDFYKPLTAKIGLELKLNKETENKELIVRTDESGLKQIMSSLLNNSLRYTNKGSIEFGYELVTDKIQFYVKDTGIGVKSNAQNLFKSYRYSKIDYLKNFKGMGLGLPASKKLATLMGGEIGVKPNAEEGAEFYFTLPYETFPVLPSIDKPDSGIAGKPGGNAILIVDDEPVNLMLLEMLLEAYQKWKGCKSFRIYKASNGKEALKLCRINSLIDVVLMDIKMPVMNGFEATQIIKSEQPELKVIALTAFNSEESKARAKAAGCDDYLTKPISKEVLFKLINKYHIAD